MWLPALLIPLRLATTEPWLTWASVYGKRIRGRQKLTSRQSPVVHSGGWESGQRRWGRLGGGGK